MDMTSFLMGAASGGGGGGVPGAPGKSAYQIAVENGFKGTVQEWLESLKGKDSIVDATLSKSGEAADAAKVGEEITSLKEDLTSLDERLTEVENRPSGGTGGSEIVGLTFETIVIEDAPVIKLTGINLNVNTLTLETGDAYVITATPIPSNASNVSIVWESSNNEIANVEDGTVTAISQGNVIITAKSGNISATCSIVVNEKAPSVIRRNFSKEEMISGILNYNGSLGDTDGFHTPEFDYHEGMTLHTYHIAAWRGANKPTFLIREPDATTYTKITNFETDSSDANKVYVTLNGYAIGSKCVINYGQSKNEWTHIEDLYYEYER